MATKTARPSSAVAGGDAVVDKTDDLAQDLAVLQLKYDDLWKEAEGYVIERDQAREQASLLQLAAILGAGILARRDPASVKSLADQAVAYAKALIEATQE